MTFYPGGFCMSIIYTCRHCNGTLATIAEHQVTQEMLGFDQLTTEEKRRMISFNDHGDLIVRVICESCKNTLDEHPSYYELEFFIQ